MLQGPRMNSRGMPQHFMGPGPMARPGMPPRQMHPGNFAPMPRMRQGQFGPMNGIGPQRKQGGGLLAKILGKGGGRGPGNPVNGLLSAGSGPARAAAGSGGGFLKTLTDPAAINGFLTNTQKVLSTAQQFGPMIQQYGPLVRNLPSMWKLYKGLKDMPNADEQSKGSKDEPENSEEIESGQQPEKKKGSAKKRRKTSASRENQTPKGSSSPKLFI